VTRAELSAWIYDDGGERHMYPCAGAWLGEGAAQTMLTRGVMPLLSRRDYPAVRLLRWQSIAEPTRGLAGPWANWATTTGALGRAPHLPR